MDRSSGLIGGGITPFSKEPYVTLSRHTAPSRNKDLPFPLTNGSSNQPVLPFYSSVSAFFSFIDLIHLGFWPFLCQPVQQKKLSAQANSLICYSIISKSRRGSQVSPPSGIIQSLGASGTTRRFSNGELAYKRKDALLAIEGGS